MENTRLNLRMSFVPDWKHIESIRCSIGPLVEALVTQPDRVAAVSMVTAELLENAHKHGTSADHVAYELDLRGEETAISVENSWAPGTEARVEAIAKAIEWIAGFESPLDAYIERMKAIYESEDIETSGLGLVRIVYEGQCAIDRQVDAAARRVRVRARFLAREDAR